MKIAVLGATGNTGKYIVDALLASGENVVSRASHSREETC